MQDGSVKLKRWAFSKCWRKLFSIFQPNPSGLSELDALTAEYTPQGRWHRSV